MSAAERPTDEPESSTQDERRRFLWTSVGVFALATTIFFWRYAFGFRTTVSDKGDPLLLIWVMEWVERALVHSPRELFDAPMFHPFEDTLAYSDPLIPQSLAALPLRLIGFGPIAAYNIVYLGGIAAAGVLTALLFFDLTGDKAASLLGAMVATFPGLRLFHLAHMQLQVTTFWPLALILVHRIVCRPGARSAAALAAVLVALPLASLYQGMFLATLLPPFVLVLWLCTPKRRIAAIGVLGAAAAAAAVVLLPFALVYRRAIAHLAQQRSNPDFSDALDYFSISPFADIGKLLHLREVNDSGPMWVGGAAAFLLPVAAIAVVRELARAWRAKGTRPLPAWVRTSAPYVVLGCFALALSIGPELRWGGRAVMPNPLGYVTRLAGFREIRDFQRMGFIVALAGGAIVAVAVAELARRGSRRETVAAFAFVAVTTAVPAFSASLPAYRPTAVSELHPVYRWLAEQPDTAVIYEVPLDPRSEIESLEYLWAAVTHKKKIIHGFSGFLPLTDEALRGEATGVHREDYFRTLSLLGATHLLVHTEALAALPGGEASLASLHADRATDRVAQFDDVEVYRVDSNRPGVARRQDEIPTKPLFSTGGWNDAEKGCLEIGPPSPPVVLFVPRTGRMAGLHFRAESSLMEMDAGLLIERSDDIRTWKIAPHGPLLSTSVAAYLAEPTPLLWTDALVPPGPGTFVRLSSKRGNNLRICDWSVLSAKDVPPELVPKESVHIATSAHTDLAQLAIDDDLTTRWHSGAPQRGDEWISLDLGQQREVVAVILELGNFASDRGRELVVDCGDALNTPPGATVSGDDALFARPRPVQVLPMAPVRSCRVLRVRQTGSIEDTYWSVAEISILERPAHRPGRVTGAAGAQLER